MNFYFFDPVKNSFILKQGLFYSAVLVWFPLLVVAQTAGTELLPTQKRDSSSGELYYFRVQEDPLTRQQVEFEYRKTLLIHPNKDTSSRNLTIFHTASGFYLESFNERKKFFPQDILGFYRQHKFYRSAFGKDKKQVFSERLVQGPLSLYWSKTQFVPATGNKKGKWEDAYFIGTTDSLKEVSFVSKQTLATTYLKNCQPSQIYLSKYMVTSRNKSIRTYLGGIFVASGFAMFITGSTETKALIPFAVFGSSFIGYSLHLASKKISPSQMAEAIQIYNKECADNPESRFRW